MKSGVPTLLIFDRKILRINHFIQELHDEFKENNIMFFDVFHRFSMDFRPNTWSKKGFKTMISSKITVLDHVCLALRFLFKKRENAIFAAIWVNNRSDLAIVKGGTL